MSTYLLFLERKMFVLILPMTLEIKKFILGLNSKKATGIDIPPKFKKTRD